MCGKWEGTQPKETEEAAKAEPKQMKLHKRNWGNVSIYCIGILRAWLREGREGCVPTVDDHRPMMVNREHMNKVSREELMSSSTGQITGGKDYQRVKKDISVFCKRVCEGDIAAAGTELTRIRLYRKRLWMSASGGRLRGRLEVCNGARDLDNRVVRVRDRGLSTVVDLHEYRGTATLRPKRPAWGSAG